MWAKYNIATGALIAERLVEAPEAAAGEGVLMMPPGAVAGLAVWRLC
jgi:hypothetical protein